LTSPASLSDAERARRWFRHRSEGVLSTLSARIGGHPFGSVVSFVPDLWGRPVFLASALAEHTRNIENDPRSSLITQAPTGKQHETQATARFTMLGEAVRIEPNGAERDRFMRYLPGASRLLALGDFSFYRIDPIALRFIGGFGDIGWIDAAAYLQGYSAGGSAPCPLDLDSDRNAELLRLCRARLGETATLSQAPDNALEVLVIGVDADGFDVRAAGQLLRFDFKRTARDAEEIRREIDVLLSSLQDGISKLKFR